MDIGLYRKFYATYQTLVMCVDADSLTKKYGGVGIPISLPLS